MLLGIFAVSCKSCNDVSPNTKRYRPVKEYAYAESGSIDTTVVYTYSNDKLSRTDVSGGGAAYYYSFAYNADGKLLKRSLYTASTSGADSYDTIVYKSDGTLDRIEEY